jgi:ADP-ribose pyrophosphatase YjhB (NUDIX family)
MKIDKSWYIKPKNHNFPSSVAAGGVVVRKEKGKLFVALVGTDYYKDYLLPKGRREDGEEIESTARREIAEETGLSNLELICKLGIKERLSFEKNDWKTIHYYLFKTDKISGKQKLQKGEEDLTLDWFDLDNLPLLFWPEQKELIEENRKRIKKLLSG